MINDYEWDMAYNAINLENYINCEVEVKGNQEKLCIVKDLINKLSDEARFIFFLLFNTPLEIVELIETKERNRISMSSLTKYLRGNGWNRKQVQSGMKELRVMKNLL